MRNGRETAGLPYGIRLFVHDGTKLSDLKIEITFTANLFGQPRTSVPTVKRFGGKLLDES